MILALRALGLGDLLTAVPALRALKRARPTEQLVLAAPQPLRPLMAMGRLADRLLPLESAVSGPPQPLVALDEPVDLAVNLHGRGPQSTDVLRRLRPAALWSYGVPGAPGWDPDEHEVSRWCRLVEHHGCPAEVGDLFLSTRAGPGEGVVVHPGAATAERRWPPGRFAAVATALASLGHRVTVTAGPGEEGLASSVAQACPGPRVGIAAGLDLAALAALVASSALVVCGDTGIAHLATALRTPSVVIFGPVPPSRWGPPQLPRHRVLWHPVPDAAAPGQPHPSLLRVSVPMVLAEVSAALEAAPSPRELDQPVPVNFDRSSSAGHAAPIDEKEQVGTRERSTSMSTDGVAAGSLADDDLDRELAHLHQTRHEVFLHGSAQALIHHTERTAQLEDEYLRRNPGREVDPHRLRSGARARDGQAPGQ